MPADPEQFVFDFASTPESAGAPPVPDATPLSKPPPPYRAPQFDFDFEKPAADPAAPDGLTTWRQQREEQLRALAQRHALPLGRRVEVELKNGIELTGLLCLAEESLLRSEEVRFHDLSLRVGSTPFFAREIARCVQG